MAGKGKGWLLSDSRSTRSRVNGSMKAAAETRVAVHVIRVANPGWTLAYT